jgi:tetratricopeptide (TPR) repeat protein
MLIRFGDFEQAGAPLQQSISLDPMFAPAYGNLAAVLMALGKYSEARAVLKEEHDRNLNYAGARRLSFLLAVVQDDDEMMKKELESSIGIGQTNAAYGWQARRLALGGHISAAHDQFRRGVQLAIQGNFGEVAAQLRAEDAETHAMVGQCEEARRESAAALALSRDNLTLERVSRTVGWCGGEVSVLVGELTSRFPAATITNRVSVPVALAALALAKGNPAVVVERLEPLKRYDHAPWPEFWPLFLRGQAYLRQGNTGAADECFRSIVSRRGESPVSLFIPLSYLELARSAVLAKNVDAAKEAYQQFFTLWKNADPGLAPIQQARAEFAKQP